MKKHHKPLKLDNLELPSNILYAPLAGCSDYPFRQMAKKYRPGLFFCEMVKMDALIRYDVGTFRILDYDASMHPIGGQIVGSKKEIAGQAARIIEELGFDVIDLNCGCPVDKVTKDGSGSGLLKTPELMGEILANMKAAVKIPVTVKIRMGWDHESINAEEITEIAEAAGAAAITIHGRTRQQGYKGEADWSPIARAKARAKKIKVIGNGDIFCGPSAEKLFGTTGCDGALVSRGTLGKPWIFEEIIRHLEGLPPIERTPDQIRTTLLNHLEKITAYQPTRRAITDLRRVSCWYLKNMTNAKTLRSTLSRIESLDDAKELILNG